MTVTLVTVKTIGAVQMLEVEQARLRAAVKKKLKEQEDKSANQDQNIGSYSDEIGQIRFQIMGAPKSG